MKHIGESLREIKQRELAIGAFAADKAFLLALDKEDLGQVTEYAARMALLVADQMNALGIEPETLLKR